jgi:hypothetical protein
MLSLEDKASITHWWRKEHKFHPQADTIDHLYNLIGELQSAYNELLGRRLHVSELDELIDHVKCINYFTD